MRCLKCGAFVEADEAEVAWECTQCGQGLQLEAAGLAPLSVHWAAARPGAQGLRWLPFWAFTGSVRFLRRETFGGRSQPDRLWDAPQRFLIPAFPCGLEEMERLGADLLKKNLSLASGPAAGRLAHCTLLPADARQAAEFVVLTIEADRRDKLRTVEFGLECGEPELWVLPFAGEAQARALALA